jgi:iron complex outermembrane receptor protein
MLPDSVLLLPEVRVDRDRPRASARDRLPTASVTDVRAGASGRAVESLADLLVQTPGVHVQQYGGLGAFSTVSLRGAPAGQVAVLLDGVPMASGAHAVVNLADLPVAAVERIEVYRGLSPFGLGVSAAGGTINLVTSARPRGGARVARGSFGTWEAHGTGGATRGAWSGLLHAGHRRSHGDFPFLDDNATPFNAADDSVTTRVNNRFESANLTGSLAWRPRPGLALSVHEDLYRKRQGVPGLGAAPALGTRLALDRSLTRIEAALGEAGARPASRLRLAALREGTRFRDPDGELGRGRRDSDDRLAADDGQLELRWARLPLGFAVQAGAGVRRERAELRDPADGRPDPPASRRDARAASAGLQWRSGGGRLVLHGAERREWMADHLNATRVGGPATSATVARTLRSPQAGAALELPGGVTARANWTRGRRAPDFTELFGDQGSVIGNPSLTPERNETWDAGLAWRSPAAWPVRASASWTHFRSHPAGLILYDRNTPSTVRAVNVASARITGDELAFDAALPAGLEAAFAATLQRAIDTGPVVFWNGRVLPQRPAHEGYARLGWRGFGWRAALDLQWLGETWLDRYNRHRLDGRTLLGARLTMPAFHPAVRAMVEGRNLTDDRATDVAGFPLPGRSLYVAIEAGLGDREDFRP